jgi:hypothetical protein
MKGSHLLDSPRRRRRLARVAVLLVVAGAVAFGITRLTLNEDVKPKEVFRKGKPVSTESKPVPLSKADREEIGRTLVAFVREGVARRDLSAAYDLVTLNYRGGTTRGQWRNGAAPVYVYPVNLHGIANNWRVEYSEQDGVGVALMLSSTRPRKVGQIIFHAEFVHRGGRWLVDTFSPVATFTPIGVGRQHETGPADFTGGSRADLRADKGELSTLWIVAPLSVLALIGLVPLAILLAGRMRDRRAARAYEATLPKTLPPLPRRN